ncbi:hypothetical protein EV182_000754 [Spiromyces aspiralis]|uniref:Uncharacterized protein n=1 Tax=Spiromyces aspiralis TaxID=68401 RepID=A0ACC1HP32_9FUNG|nr:hypothetical protein EV182_000754 [Spiromyces aspiralis]
MGLDYRKYLSVTTTVREALLGLEVKVTVTVSKSGVFEDIVEKLGAYSFVEVVIIRDPKAEHAISVDCSEFCNPELRVGCYSDDYNDNVRRELMRRLGKLDSDLCTKAISTMQAILNFKGNLVTYGFKADPKDDQRKFEDHIRDVRPSWPQN